MFAHHFSYGKDIALIRDENWIQDCSMTYLTFIEQFPIVLDFVGNQKGILIQYMKPSFWMDSSSKAMQKLLALDPLYSVIKSSDLQIDVMSINRQTLLESGNQSFTQYEVDNTATLMLATYNHDRVLVDVANDEPDRFLTKRHAEIWNETDEFRYNLHSIPKNACKSFHFEWEPLQLDTSYFESLPSEILMMPKFNGSSGLITPSALTFNGQNMSEQSMLTGRLNATRMENNNRSHNTTLTNNPAMTLNPPYVQSSTGNAKYSYNCMIRKRTNVACKFVIANRTIEAQSSSRIKDFSPRCPSTQVTAGVTTQRRYIYEGTSFGSKLQ